MNILIIGGPGTGEGTMFAKIVEKFNVNHISTEDTFCNEIGKGTVFGMETKSFMDKGLLAPGKVVNSMVKSYLEKLEDKKNGFLLDGHPRTLGQTKTFDALTEGSELAIGKVIALEIDFEKLADRVTGHRIYKGCGEIHHIKSRPSKIDNVCDIYGGELFQRKDDTVESLTVRLEECSSQTAPVLDYYDSKGTVTRIDASQPADSVWSDALTTLGRREW